MLVEHIGKRRLNAVVAAAEIHVEKPPPGFTLNVLKLLLLCNARVIDKQRYLSKGLPDALSHGLDLGPVGDVRLIPHGPAALGVELIAELPGKVPTLKAVYTHGVARLRQRRRTGRADASG